MKILDRESAAALDSKTVDKGLVDFKGLMSNAGKVVADYLTADLGIVKSCDILIVCGVGNNGGDGLAAAGFLRQRGFKRLKILLVGKTGSASAIYSSFLRKTRGIRKIVTEKTSSLVPLFEKADLILDALLGTGLNRAVSGLHQDVIKLINDSPAIKVSVDLPSGMPSDSSEPIGPHVHADHTITIGLPKIPLILHPLRSFRGRLAIRNIGFSQEDLDTVESVCQYYEENEARKDFLPRPEQCHKNDFGHLGVWAGSPTKTGAAFLSSQSALVSGTGLVTTYCEREIWPILATKLNEVMVVPLEGSIAASSAAITSKRTLLVGPGLGETTECVSLFEAVLKQSKGTVILDADGLNILAKRPDLISLLAGRGILTPHLGEMTRLLKKEEPLSRMDSDTVKLVGEFAEKHQLIVVLKSSDTLVFGPKRDAPWIIGSGNVGLAKAGSGDVLAGLIAGIVCQYEELSNRGLVKSSLIRQVLFATYLHGVSADLAMRTSGRRSLTATELIRTIPLAFLELEVHLFHHQRPAI